MKKGQIYQGVCREIRFPNRAVIQTEEGETCVVDSALPGETVEIRVEKARNGRYEGRLLRVLQRSSEETARDVCPHFGVCGGCLYQTLPYVNQLRLKEYQVRQMLDRLDSEYKWEGIKASPQQFGYRNKMEYSFGNEEKDGPLTLGLHKRSAFYDIIPVRDCRIVDEDFRAILSLTQAFFRALEIPYYHKLKHTGVLRNLVVRKGMNTGEIMVCLVTTRGLLPEIADGYANTLRAISLKGTLVSVLHLLNDLPADVVQAEQVRVLYGQNYFYEKLFGLSFRITPFAFFPPNTSAAKLLFETVRGYLGTTKDQDVYDLYCGTGTITQVLAPAARTVIGVEIVPEAVEDAIENAKMNGLTNVRFICGDVLDVIDRIEEKPDLIVLDPPREGIHPKALQKILNFGVKRIVYISCKLTSLVRDIEVFQQAGYCLERASAIDMFVGTVNIETVAVLTKARDKRVRS